MNDHCFEVRMVGPEGAEIPPARFRTLQEAMNYADSIADACGSIWYQDTGDNTAIEVLRYNMDGSVSTSRTGPTPIFR